LVREQSKWQQEESREQEALQRLHLFLKKVNVLLIKTKENPRKQRRLLQLAASILEKRIWHEEELRKAIRNKNVKEPVFQIANEFTFVNPYEIEYFCISTLSSESR